MFKPSTVLIVGAGASAEVGLPVGTALVEQVAGIIGFERNELTGRLPEHNDFVRELMNRAGPGKLREYEKAAVKMVRGMRSAAETVVFLGFGFYEENLQLIEPDGATQVKLILGTGHGLSPSAKSVVEGRLGQWDKGEPPTIEVVTSMKCVELLNHYRLRLSA